MSKSNKGVIAVILGGCGLGLTLGLLYLFVWAPMQTAEKARKEIADWGENWEETRRCLLSEDPKSSDSYLALLANDALAEQTDRRLASCVNHIKKLRRQDGGSSEDDAIEDAWSLIPKAVGKLAQAQMWRSASEPNKSMRELRADLAEGIDAVESAYEALRAAAKMKAVVRPTIDMPRLEALITLGGPEGAKGEVRAEEVAIHNDSISYIARAADSSWRALVSAEGSDFDAVSPLALRAAQSDWGMWFEADGIPLAWEQAGPGAHFMAGPLDAQGEPGGDGTLLHTLGESDSIRPYFGIGEQRRIALFRFQHVDAMGYLNWEYRMLYSEDGGATFRQLPITKGELWPTLRWKAVGSSLMWDEGPNSTVLHWQRLTSDGPVEHTLRFGGERGTMEWPPHLCEREKRSWWFADRSVYTLGPDGVLSLVPGELHERHRNYGSYMSCTEDSVAVSHVHMDDDGQQWLRFQRCSDQRCDKGLQQVPLGRVAAGHHLVYHAGQWKAVLVAERLVSIWTRGAAPDAVYALDGPADSYGALTWGEDLALLVWPDDAPAPHLLRIPTGS